MLFAALAMILGQQSEIDFNQPFHIEYAPAHHIRVTWQVARECPETKVQGWEIYAAKPPTLPFQRVLSAQLIVDGKKIGKPKCVDLSPAHVPLLGTQIASKSNKVDTQCVYEVTTYSRRIVPGKATEPVERLGDRERRLDLSSTKEFDFKSPTFQSFLDTNDLRRHPGEPVMTFAHRVYQFVRKGMKYRADAPFDTSLSTDCQSSWGHCGNYSRRVVGIMRANQIPARMSFGHWILGGTKTYDEGQFHTRSEIYVESVGWVLLDTSRGVPDGGWKPESDLDCGFGVDEGWFFVLHLNSSLLIPTVAWGPQLQEHLQTTYTPAIGGSWEGSKTICQLKVEELGLGG